MPTKTVVNVQTGEVTIVELSGEELAAYEAAVAAQAAEAAAQPQVEGE